MALPPIPPGPDAMALALPPERRRKLRKNVVDSQLVAVNLGFQKGALLLDLSEEGMGVQALSQAPLGATTALLFDLPDTLARIEGMGLVAWTDNSGRVGIRFSELSSASRAHLTQWLSRWNDAPSPAPTASQAPSGPPLEPDEAEALQREIRQTGLRHHAALDLLVQRGQTLTRATGAAIALGLDGRIVCVATSGNAPDLGVALNPHAGLSGECVRTGEIVRCADTETDPRADRLICRRLNLRSAVVLPLRRQQLLLGVLEVFSDVPHAFENSDVLLLRRLAELVVSLASAATIITPDPAASPTEVPAVLSSEEKPALLGLAEVSVAGLLPPSPPLPPQAVQLVLPEKPAALPSEVASAAAIQANPGLPAAPARATQPGSATPPPAPNAPEVATVTPTTASATTPVPEEALRAYARTAILSSVFKVVLAATIALGVVFSIWQSQQGVNQGRGSRPAAVRPEGPRPAASVVTPSSITGGKLIQRVEPAYPEAARQQKLQGLVILKAKVGKHGRVQHVEVVSGQPLLAGAAAEAVQRWRYEPFRRNGEPVERETFVIVPFLLPSR